MATSPILCAALSPENCNDFRLRQFDFRRNATSLVLWSSIQRKRGYILILLIFARHSSAGGVFNSRMAGHPVLVLLVLFIESKSFHSPAASGLLFLQQRRKSIKKDAAT